MPQLPLLTYVDSNTYRVDAPPGWVAPTLSYHFQDGVERTFNTAGVEWTPTIKGEGGLDAWPLDEASTWYRLYLVPKVSSQLELTVMGSKTTPAAGGPNYAFGNHIYLGSVYNSSGSDLYRVKQLSDGWSHYALENELGHTVHGYAGAPLSGWQPFVGTSMEIAVPGGIADAAIFEMVCDSDTGGWHQWQIANIEEPPNVTSWAHCCVLSQSNTRCGNTVIRPLGPDPSMQYKFAAFNDPVNMYVRCIGWHDGYRLRST